jgi:hypothetical protein
MEGAIFGLWLIFMVTATCIGINKGRGGLGFLLGFLLGFIGVIIMLFVDPVAPPAAPQVACPHCKSGIHP